MRLIKIVLTIIIVVSIIAFFGCAPKEQDTGADAQGSPEEPVQPTPEPEEVKTEQPTPEPEEAEPEMLSLTLEELAQYNGQGGNPAYVAVDGVIYDVSAISAWAGGRHNGLAAGNDLTQEIKTRAPHGISVLSALPKVGTIKE